MKILIVKDRNVLNTKFAVEFANSLAEKGHEVVFASNSAKKIGGGYSFSPAVRFVNLCSPAQRLLTALKLGALAYRALIRAEDPDLIVTFFFRDLLNVTLFQKHRARIVQMFHNYPANMFATVDRAFFIRRRLTLASLRRVAAFQVLMPSFEAIVRRRFPGTPVFSVPNVVRPVAEEARADPGVEKKRVVYIARVEGSVKRQHLVIEAFSAVAEEFPEWQLDLWGSLKHPAYTARLQAMIQRSGLAGRVHLHGNSNDVTGAYREADFQVFASAHEGFGLALMEGMACGLPAIGFRASPAVNELIVDGENGFLAADTAEVAARMRELMRDPALRKRMGQAALASAAPYAPERVAEAWDRNLRKVFER